MDRTQEKQSHEVEVLRVQPVKILREAASFHFGARLYRITLTCSSGYLDKDDASLEDCGVTEEGMNISVSIAEEEPWMSAPFPEFLGCLVRYGVIDSNEAITLQRRLIKFPEEDSLCRATYLPRLKVLESKQKSMQLEAQRAEFEATRLAQEKASLSAEGQEQAQRLMELVRSTRWPQRLVPLAALPLVDLVTLAVASGILSGALVTPATSGAGGMEFRAQLVEHVACQNGIDIWSAEADSLRASVTAVTEKPLCDNEQHDDIQLETKQYLERVMPELNAAEDALRLITKQDFSEIRAFAAPSLAVMQVVEAVCLLLGVPLCGDNAVARWQTAKTTVLKDSHFIGRLLNFDKDNIDDHAVRKLERIITNDGFSPERVEKMSKVVKGLCMWVRAICAYHPVAHLVQCKREMARRQMERLRVNAIAAEIRRAQLLEAEETLLLLRREQASLCCLSGLLTEPKSWSSQSLDPATVIPDCESSSPAVAALCKLRGLVATLRQTPTHHATHLDTTDRTGPKPDEKRTSWFAPRGAVSH